MQSITGETNIRSHAAALLSDESLVHYGVPHTLFYPQTTEDLITIVKKAQSAQRKLCLIGGQTGITAGAVPIEGSFAVSFEKMNSILRIEKISEKELILFCQPGVTIQEIIHFLEDPASHTSYVEGVHHVNTQKWMYPPDPTEKTCHIGGSVATNASGSRSFRFGPTRTFVHSLSMVFATADTKTLQRSHIFATNGKIILPTDQSTVFETLLPTYRSPTQKNAAGYFVVPGMDVLDLFIGSEGTLALFSEIGIRLIPSCEFISGLSFFSSMEQAFECADSLRMEASISALEYFDSHALQLVRDNSGHLSFHCSAYPPHSTTALFWECCSETKSNLESKILTIEHHLTSHGSSLDATWSGIDKNESAILHKFRHAVPELINKEIASYKKNVPEIRKFGTDAAVGVDKLYSYTRQCIAVLENEHVPYIIFGHIGDCHLHINLIPSTKKELTSALQVYEKLMEIVLQANGTVSAEHGIGKLKTHYLEKMYGSEAIQQMKAIKQTFDPQWLLNPGNVFRLDDHIHQNQNYQLQL